MSENENNFETLRSLLALKQHEVPPPGYFEGFSSQVIGRIRAGEATEQLPWLLRFLQAFEAKPAFPVALASSMCILLLYGIVSVQQNPGISSVIGDSAGFPMATTISQVDPSQPLVASVNNTNPPADLSANSSLFGSQSNPYFHQEGLVMSGN